MATSRRRKLEVERPAMCRLTMKAWFGWHNGNRSWLLSLDESELELSESLRAPLLTHHSPSMDALEAALIREVRKHFDSLRQQAHFGKG